MYFNLVIVIDEENVDSSNTSTDAQVLIIILVVVPFMLTLISGTFVSFDLCSRVKMYLSSLLLHVGMFSDETEIF